MKYKLLLVCLGSFMLSGCKLLAPIKGEPVQTKVHQNGPLCVWKNTQQSANCDIEFWLWFWSNTESLSWPERKQQIEVLTNSDTDMLKKILLSQGKNTPFQNRLRAQTWFEAIFPRFTPEMQQFMDVAVFQPSQDLLELESALVTLSKINTQQSLTNDEQQVLLEEQRNKIEQLLNIEASIIQSTEENK